MEETCQKSDILHLVSLGASPTGYIRRRRKLGIFFKPQGLYRGGGNFSKSQSLFGVNLRISPSPIAYIYGGEPGIFQVPQPI